MVWDTLCKRPPGCDAGKQHRVGVIGAPSWRSETGHCLGAQLLRRAPAAARGAVKERDESTAVLRDWLHP